MKPKFLPILERCLEVGIERGWQKAHKYHEKPEQDVIFNEIYLAIEVELYEWFNFDEE